MNSHRSMGALFLTAFILSFGQLLPGVESDGQAETAESYVKNFFSSDDSQLTKENRETFFRHFVVLIKRSEPRFSIDDVRFVSNCASKMKDASSKAIIFDSLSICNDPIVIRDAGMYFASIGDRKAIPLLARFALSAEIIGDELDSLADLMDSRDAWVLSILRARFSGTGIGSNKVFDIMRERVLRIPADPERDRVVK